MTKFNFLQGNGETWPVTIDMSSKRKFGIAGFFMWVVTFDNGAAHYMTRDDILNATGVDMKKRGGIYHKDNIKLAIKE